MEPAQPHPSNLTSLLRSWRQGDGAAFDKLIEQVYAELKRMAAARLRTSDGLVTLTPTELLHDAVERVMASPTDWNDRAHFFATVSLLMRAVLVDHARARLAQKRGGDLLRVTLTESGITADTIAADVLAIHEALSQLEREDERSSDILQLTYFAGLSRTEIADVLKISIPTVDRELRFARAWLSEALRA